MGAILDDPAWTEPWTPPHGSEPLVLVAMSSTYQKQDNTIRRVVDALARLQVRGLVTLGPALQHIPITTPPNVTLLPSAPHNQVLQHAHLVITHGGHGTVIKALAADVPMLVLPHGRDQRDNGARVSLHNAGIMLPKSASSRRITRAAHTLLTNPTYRLGAQRLGHIVRTDAQAGKLITELEMLPQRADENTTQ